MEKNKIAEKVYNWMSRDNLNGIIILDNEKFYFEKTNSTVIMPDYIYHYLKKWAKKQGYSYLYDN